MDAIVAVYSDWGIGADGTQPVVLKADRQRFVELTRGRTVIVGRKTLADFPGGRPLKGRRNIVLTRQNAAIDGADRVFVTKINCCPQSDSYFENLDASADWRIASQSEALREGDIEYSFVCYERIKP